VAVSDEPVGFDDEPEEVSAPAGVAADATDRAIERHFETGRLRVVQERSELFLPHVVDFIERDKWGNLRPEYQRRLRWDDTKKSRLIESFIMNVPVPPVFLYEVNLGSYEVMDGQQRLNAIVDFLQGRFELTGLKIWPSLNGRSFARLPPMVRRGLERAKVSSITLMSDSSASSGDDMDLRAQVFERLNTGGERLNPQELRNSLFSGSFNRLIVELAKLPEFSNAWDIPSHQEHTRSDGTSDQILRDNNLFKRMLDVEIVLRFFAFRDDNLISGSVRAMLDNTMKSLRGADDAAISVMRADFVETLATALSVFGEALFRLPPPQGRTKGPLSRPIYDAEMVAIFRLRHRRDEILAKAPDVSASVLALASQGAEKYELMVGRGNTAALIRERIALVHDTIVSKL